MSQIPTAPGGAGTSTRPYLIRALHDWCTDNGFTPYIAVFVDSRVQVPVEYVKNNEIVLNLGFEATSGLQLGNEVIEFKARFGGTSREILVPIDHVIAIYARENGQGMAFPVPSELSAAGPVAAVPADAAKDETRPAGGGLRLASTDGNASSAPMRPESDSAAENEDSPPPEPPGAGAPGAGRPALKRVK
jgi:stringent starvation protein B